MSLRIILIKLTVPHQAFWIRRNENELFRKERSDGTAIATAGQSRQ